MQRAPPSSLHSLPLQRVARGPARLAGEPLARCAAESLPPAGGAKARKVALGASNRPFLVLYLAEVSDARALQTGMSGAMLGRVTLKDRSIAREGWMP